MFRIIQKIDSPEEVMERIPFCDAFKKIKQSRDKILRDIIAGRDKRLLLIVGPCSADNEDAVCEYARSLAAVAEKIRDFVFIVPRVYTTKPRTRCEGYKGMLHKPIPYKETDMREGILRLRRLHIRVVAESGLTSADEMLYPENYAYLSDVLSYVVVGARSAENQQHRLTASGVDVPVGIKNPMSGNITTLMNSVYAAQCPHMLQYGGHQMQTNGNPYAHGILRGYTDANNRNRANYHYENLMNVYTQYKREKLVNPAVLVDANHGNSNKNPLKQAGIVREVLRMRKQNSAISELVKGFLLESYIEDGKQTPDGGVYGKSVTDACLGWKKTEKLIYEMVENL